MGRWAQRQKTGGGHSINFMTSARNNFANFVEVGYLTNVGLTSLTPQDFTSSPSMETDPDVSVPGSGQILLEFGSDVSGDTQLIYNGTVAGILNPQTIVYSP